MRTEPGKFYVARYSFPKGGPTLLTSAAESFSKVGKVVGIEDYGPDKPAWMNVFFQAKAPVNFEPGEELGAGVILSSIEPAVLSKIEELTPWPGLGKVAEDDLLKLYAAVPISWDFDGLLGHISSESRFNPKAQAKTSTARGLIQMTKATQAAFGPIGDTFESQIVPLVKYFKASGKDQMRGADYKLWGFAPGILKRDGWDDSVVLYKKGTAAAKDPSHRAFLDSAGNMTVSTIRKWWDWWISGGYKKAGSGPVVSRGAQKAVAGVVAFGAIGLALLLAFSGRKR